MMQTNPSAQVTVTTHDATVTMLAKRQSLPRLFVVTWDNSRAKTRDPRKNEKQEAWGTLYPNGFVTLDTDSRFETMSEMHHLLGLRGKYEIRYLDEEEVAQ